jgi:hypothetical protein
VSRENLPWLGLAILLLAGGWFVSQRLVLSSPTDQDARETFREWLWGTRSLDLAVQVGIIFVGALGIAALLPRGDETLRGDETPHRDPDTLGSGGSEEQGRQDERL